MHVAVRWETAYRYSMPVRLLHTELRVLPADAFGQRLLSGAIHLDPDARPFALGDAFGNRYHHVDFLQDVDCLHIAVEAEVATLEEPLADPDLTPILSYLYRQPTARSPFDASITALASEIPTDLDPVSQTEVLMETFRGRFIFEVGSTDVAATATDFFAVGRGVCQDFSHLMLSLLRQRGLAARYVSGYLAPAAGEEFAEASHAWVQVYDGEAWHGFDPANGCRQDGRYVITAVGRDYDDLPPLRGTYQGLATEEWSTSVRIRSGE